MFAATTFVAATESAPAPAGPPVFNAVITTGKETRFVLISAAGKTSEWIHLGDSFEGVTLKAFDPATSTLEVEEDGQSAKLTLVSDAAIKDAPAAAPGTHATLADAENVLQVMRFEGMMEKILAQQKKQMRAMAQQMAARMERPGVNKEELAAFQQKVMEEMTSALNAADLKKDMAQIYSDIFTKEELDAQAAFYLTPVGQSMVTKTPEVQARLQAVMMPRIQAAMPKVQQMIQQFKAEQQAKAAAAAPAGTAPTSATPAATPKN